MPQLSIIKLIDWCYARMPDISSAQDKMLAQTENFLLTDIITRARNGEFDETPSQQTAAVNPPAEIPTSIPEPGESDTDKQLKITPEEET